ncbi:helix-turn-helix transcriptional regulator [Lentzea aerocolonigenes]|uniref:helix-turn-helix transcriptional regulator n=1 Tax=Lentzea aerocolonigenes TaxID=68170 RepID=UPI0004C3368D|nr:LuxR family transcriptional regulator [Lentzea aerocolonigenes]
MLHGRDHELNVIRRLIEEARGGVPGVLVLRGEAGVGKTALLEEARTHADGMTVLFCSGNDLEAGFAFSGLHQLLLPVLAEIDSLPAAQATALRSALGMEDTHATDFAVCAAAFSLLTTVSEGSPLLVVADDVQWLDDSTMAALMFLVRRLVADPIAVLFAVRDPSEVNTSFLPELPLTGLSREAAAELLSRNGWRSSDAVREALIESTGGNPLALAELVRTGAEGGLAHDLVMGGTVPLSSSLQSAFARRVDELSPDARLLTLVFAAEPNAPVGALLAAAERIGLPETALLPIEQSGLVRLRGSTVSFDHPLIRSAVYQAALFHDRSRVHLALAAELGERNDSGRAIHHRAMAATGPDEPLAAELARTADRIVERGGAAAAAHVMRRAAELSPDRDDRSRRLVGAAYAAWRSGQAAFAKSITEQVGTEIAGSGTRLEAQVSRLRALIETDSGDPALGYALLSRTADAISASLPEEAMWVLFLAMESARLAGDLEGTMSAGRRIGELRIDPVHDQLNRWMEGSTRGVAEKSGSNPHEVLELASTVLPPGDPRRSMVAMALAMRGHDTKLARDFGIEVAGQLRAIGMTNVLTMFLNWLAELEYDLGLWHDGISHAGEAARLTLDSGQHNRRAQSLALLARYAAVMGDEEACLEHVRDATALAVPHGNRNALAMCAWAQGLLHLVKPDPEAALEHLLAIDSPSSPQTSREMARQVVPDLVEAAHWAGAADKVVDSVSRYEEFASGANLSVYRAGLHRCHAMIGDTDVEAALERALAEESLRQFPFHRARTQLFHGRWLRRNRRQSEAREQLKAAAEVFASLGASGWEAAAAAELRAAGGLVPQSTPEFESLTPQELHVAQLAAQGLSNKEIAIELFISPRTVGYHLYKLFPKLGIASRAQLRNLRAFREG